MKAPTETFTFFGATFDVSGLRTLAEKQGRAIQRLGLDSVARLCNFRAVARDEPGLSVFAIDPQRAAELPAEALQEPGLVVRFADSTLLIDGHHRAYRLWRQGQESMPVYVFDDAQTLARYSNVPRRVLKGRAA